MKRSVPLVTAVVAASALALAGCAGTAAPEGTSADGKLQVVTSTNVYGDIVSAIAGDTVDVTAIISSTSQDPHEYEATAKDQLAVSKAGLLIENGGGYDSFMDALVEATGTKAPVISAVEFSHDWPGNDGHDHSDDHSDAPTDDPTTEASDVADDHSGHDHIEGFNEHVWYDPHTIEHVAEKIAEELTVLVPSESATFSQGLADFTAGISTLEGALDTLSAAHAGEKIFITEPVPLYLTTAAGLENVTPDAFSEAVEEGQDVPPATLLEATRILEAGDVRILIANSQTGGAETTQVIELAKKQGIPVLEFSEIKPQDQTYLQWMEANVALLADTLNR
ncbi:MULTISPECIES: metal ABC transporter solute-binding protein, Zn/Mn family [unclassified Microbacterium]|uniref:metal ABC transporter solute-binding protein, Zn/Mn family n=1 Tax=unclassified Microbacterium TaxID=2609290 RepID=UPI00301863A1